MFVVLGKSATVIDVFTSIAFIHSRAESCDSTAQCVWGRNSKETSAWSASVQSTWFTSSYQKKSMLSQFYKDVTGPRPEVQNLLVQRRDQRSKFRPSPGETCEAAVWRRPLWFNWSWFAFQNTLTGLSLDASMKLLRTKWLGQTRPNLDLVFAQTCLDLDSWLQSWPVV